MMIRFNILFAYAFVCLFSLASSFKLNARHQGSKLQLNMGPISAISKLVKGKKALDTTYDYVIVGGGTAGCVLANRLSEDENKKILVIEAGSQKFNNKYIKIPAGIRFLFQSEFDWNYGSVPEASVKDREIYICRGKVLGGSSCVNVLLYHRGNAKDYEQWEDLSGSDEWGPNKVLPYFKKSQDDYRGESKFHGSGGELSVDHVRYQNPLSKTYLDACAEKGYPANDDFNNWDRSQEGFGRYHVTEKNGARCSAASGFLKPVMKRKNLDISTSTVVKKIIIEGGKATGVELMINGETRTIGVKDGGEVLLTGGAINSPQLLMLSGVGPAEHLKNHGIDVKVDSPHVGKNLQDHPAAVVSYSLKPEHEGLAVTSKIRIKGTKITNPKVVLQYLLRKSGPFTSVGCDHGGFFKTDEEYESPDLQMRFLAARALSPDGMSTYTKFRDSAVSLDGFSFQSIVSRPFSRGSVELKSNNPLEKPAIRTGYFQDEKDLKTIREGIRLSRRLAETSAFAPYKDQEVFPGAHVQSDEELNDYIRSTAHTSNAFVGTCRIGKSIEDSVVGSDLKVHGVKGLRVVDSSVMPKIPGGQTSAPTIMIAEKAVDFIHNA